MRTPHPTSPRTRTTVYLKILAVLVLLVGTIGSPLLALAQTPPDVDPGGAGHVYLPMLSPGGQAPQPQGEQQSQEPAPPVVEPTPAPENPGGEQGEEQAPPDNDIIIREVSPSDTGATIASDLPDYPPGATVTLTGLRWAPDEVVHIFVNDDVGQTWTHHSNPDPVADATGTFTYSFNLPLWFVANYGVLAKGPISGEATTTFTDLNIGTYDQCSNDDGDGSGGNPGTCSWINGNLQRNNSIYMEGDATVQRLWLTDLVPGTTHSVTLKYGTTKGGKHAYDFLTTWDWSEDWITLADLCDAVNGPGTIPGCTTASQTTFPIPDDPNVTNLIEVVGGVGRLFTMAGGTITSASTPVIVSGNYAGDSETIITVSYTVGPSNGAMCGTKGNTTTCGVMLWFGAHVSVSGQWTLYDGTTGAGDIEGSPYHVALDKVDGAAVGQRDNQMQANVVTYMPPGTIVLVKDAAPNDAQDFAFNLNNNSTIDFGAFYLDDDADATLPSSQSFSVPPGMWYAKELMPVPQGWSLTNLVCVDPTNNTTVDLAAGIAKINLASSETVTCTFNNTRVYNQDLTVTKTAEESFTRTYAWDIYKYVDKTRAEIAEGGTALFNYTVGVTHDSGTDSGFVVAGVITVHNPNAFAVNGVTISDVALGGTCTVADGVNRTVPAGSDVTVYYSCTFAANPGSGTNTATATWDAIAYNTPAGSATGTAGYDFAGVIPSIAYAAVNVADSLGGNLGPVSYTDPSPKEFTYAKPFSGVAGTCTKYDNTATISENGDFAKQSVEVCVGADLIVSKTAVPTFTRTWDWTIAKDFDGIYNLFAGQSVMHSYKVTVTPTPADSAWKVVGMITIQNPNAWEAIVADVSDSVDNGGACTLDVPAHATVTVPASGAVEVPYTCIWTTMPTSYTGINTASVSWDHAVYATPSGTANGAQGFEFKHATEINPIVTVDDDNLAGESWSADRTYTEWSYNRQFDCSADPASYTAGTYGYEVTNTAKINETTGDSDAAKVTVNCYAPVVSKTAKAEWRKKYGWTISKSADPAAHTGFAGDSFSSTYEVFVDQTVTDYGYLASGTIDIKNPAGAPGAMTLNVADMVSGGFAATVTCAGAPLDNPGAVSVLPGDVQSCRYSVGLPDNASRVNTATATFNGIGFSATADVVFGAPLVEGYPTVNVTDSVQGVLGAASEDKHFTYSRTFTCSTNASDYTNYKDADTYGNTATVDETGATGSASVKVDCYIPEISKAAAGAYDERHEWNIEKTATPVSQSAFAGDTVSYEWTVTVVETVHEEKFVASGTITLVNHNAEDAMIVALSDVLSDDTAATITACTGDTDLSDGLTVAAGGTSICGYTASPSGRTANQNTATAVLNGIAYKASADLLWTPNVIRSSVSLDDDQNPNLPPTIADGGTWKYTEQYTCSTDKGVYHAALQKYSFSEGNTAVVKAGETVLDSATASAAVNCFVPTISKDANGTYDEVHDWEVFKTVNTASQTAFAGEKRNFTWTVRVDETTHGESYLVTGKITVVNPNPEDALTVAVDDKLDDGAVATIGPCTGGMWSSPQLTVPAGGTATCDYSVTPKGDMAAFGAALPAQVNMSVQYPYDGGPSYFPITTITGDGALNGTYEGWCADIDHSISQNTNYSANVYSSYEILPAGIIEKAYNLDLVNWIINQDYVGKPAGGSLGYYTYGDVQRTIWELIEDNGTANTNGLGSWNQTRVNQIKAAATAAGEGFVPSCGDFVAVVLQPVGGQQLVTIAQVTFASLGIDCAGSNVATAVLNGVEFPASAEILWTVNKINETATLDDDQMSDWPTTVSADTTFTYQDPQGYTCSTDPKAYTDGFYQYDESNMAVLTYQTGSDTATASTAVKCYAPVVSKTAAGTYDERHEWDVAKSVTPLSQDILAGSTGSFDWTVTVVESVFEENFVASGTISVKNPRTDGTMTVKLSDVLSDGFVPAITGCTGGTWNATNKTVAVPPNTTAICSYTASLAYSDHTKAPGNNTVTAELLAGTTYLVTTASDAVEWMPNVIRGSATLDDDQNPNLPQTITEGGTWTYKDGYICSTSQDDYRNGSYTSPENNTATVTSGDKGDSATANTNVTCHAPVVTKDVATYFNRDWDWTVTKVEDAIYDLFAGASVTHGYKVTVTPKFTDNFWGVKGTITIANSHPTQAMVLASVGDLAGGINGRATCPSLTVPAGGSLTCTYDTGPQTAPDANPFGNLNTATAVFAAADWTGTAPIIFSTSPATEDEPVITVDDNNLTGEVWSADRASAEWSYTRDFACSANPADYTDGKYDYSLTNTATINETGQTDTAKVDVNCFAPKVIKTAVTYWNRDWDWTITKDFDGSYNLFAGDTVTHGYKVTVDPTFTDNFWGVKGTITVYNYHPTEDMTLKGLTDLAGGIDGNVTCASLVVPKNGRLTCTYDTGAQTAPNANPFGTLNTATAVFAGANWAGTYPIVFSTTPTTEDEPVITVDDNNLTGEVWSADRSKGEWTYTKEFVCSSNPDDYTDGKYAYSHTNTATINETGQKDTAQVGLTCYWPQIALSKSGHERSKIGDDVDYDIIVYNDTPVNLGLRALSCTVSDPKIGFARTAELASGAKDETYGIKFTIPTGASDPFVNTASVTCKPVAAVAPVVGDETFAVSDSDSWSTNLFQPKVEIVKTGPAYATSGDVITYKFTVNNLSSPDSPNLMLDSLSDNVLGDLKAAALAAGCDNLVYNGTCTFTVTYKVPDVGLQAITKTNIVTVHYHPADFPNDIWDSDDHTVTVTPKSQLTDTSFCPLANNQFRLLYHLESAPNIYRLQGLNPGQYYFNGFYFGAPGTDFTMQLQVPYPFVTQEGAGVPIQVHDGTSLTSGGCYSPNPSLGGFTITTPAMTPTSSAGNQIITPEDYATKNLGSYTTVTVSGKVPATGMVYVTIHLDYALKKTGGWKMTGTFTTNPVSGASIANVNNGAVTIHGYEVYNFARTVGGDTSITTPSSYNEIKKFAGFLGFVIERTSGKPVQNMKVVIYNPNNAVLATLYTDEDGYYMFPYKHTSKSATYTVKVPADNQSKPIAVKANGFAPVDFEVSQAAAQSTQAGFAPAEVAGSAGPVYLPVIIR